MAPQLRLSFRFLDRRFHGRRDGGEPEWPPSPLRCFQALVAAAGRIGGRTLGGPAIHALEWLERQPPPILIGPSAVATTGYRISVPNNAMDVVARAWCRGNESNSGDANPATHRTMKGVRPSWLLDGDVIHYIWAVDEPVADAAREDVGILCHLARSVVALGWGVDLVVGDGAPVTEEQVAALPGERWSPVSGGVELRVPVAGTLQALIHRHDLFTRRIGADGFTPPPPLSRFAMVGYARAAQPPPRHIAAFSLLRPHDERLRAFDTCLRGVAVAGMMRHATRQAASDAGWSPTKIDTFVLGHGEKREAEHHVAVGPNRFAFLPLPTLEQRRGSAPVTVGSIRRVMVSSFSDECRVEIEWAKRALDGRQLQDERDRQPVALLSQLAREDPIVRQYTRASHCWKTVTPVVLPGWEDPRHYRRRLKVGVRAEEQKRLLARLDERVDRLLRKAITHAGFSLELAEHAEIEWRKAGYLPGAEWADRYVVPAHLKMLPRYHVQIAWRDRSGRPVELPGPICIGSGRFFGAGLFVASSADHG